MDNFKLNNIYQGFKLIRNEYLDEISSKILIFEHEKTKAKLIYINNDDFERSFSISFRTPSIDDTGIAHILEHSVLCGSKNFSIKDPFAQLLKGTIHTFLNAFTFPDKTMYPFATTNLSEYRKLMEVYLDSVFNPNIYSKKEIFLQEGWRYDFDLNNKLMINGVVFSEMKGVYSSPENILEIQSLKNLFPDTQYKYDSGGNPLEMPNLSYEKFLNYHKTYYHPSNSYIYLYGDLKIIDELKYINDNYLSKYDYLKVDSKLKFQNPFKEKLEKIFYYPISEDEDINNKCYFDYSFVISDAQNTEVLIAFDILSKILLAQSSPLRKALTDAQIGEDISGGFNMKDMILQPIFNIKISNANIKKKEEFKLILINTLKNIVKSGLDKNLIDAAISKKEFELKEKLDTIPISIIYGIEIMNSYLYDFDPLSNLKYNSHLEKIKNLSNNNYFEKLIQKYLINNEHALFLSLEAKKDLDFEKNLNEKLEIYFKNLSTKEIDNIKQDSLNVEKWQCEDDSKTELNKIKTLSLSKIDKNPKKIEYDEINLDLGKLLYVKDDTKEIVYLNFLFNIKHIPIEKFSYLSLLSSLLQESKTKNYDFDDFTNMINIYTGALGVSLIGINDKDQNFSPKLQINIKYFKKNQNKIIEILDEIFNNILFDELKVKEILNRIKSRLNTGILEKAHLFAFSRINYQISEKGFFNEKISGIDYYFFIKDLADNFLEKKEEILNNLNDLYKIVFNKDSLLMSLVSNDLDLDFFKKITLKETKHDEIKFKIESSHYINEAFLTKSQVNYVAKGFNFRKLGFDYNHKLKVLKTFLSKTYLWEELRMKGGAYGAMNFLDFDGENIYISYRDPNIINTLEKYDEIPKYLSNLKISKSELDKNIIGTISNLDEPIKSYEKGSIILYLFIKKISYEDLKNARAEILNTKVIDLKNFSKLIDETLKQNLFCVIGNNLKIEENKEIFDIIINPFK